MGTNSKINWTHHTWNFWRGCTKVSPGCAHCYAEKMSKRNPGVLGEWGPNGQRVLASEVYWKLPYFWNIERFQCSLCGAWNGPHREKCCIQKCNGTKADFVFVEHPRVFSLSLGDWLEDRPELALPRLKAFQVIAQTENLDYLLLTKRPENFEKVLNNTRDAAIGQSIDDIGGGLRLVSNWLNGRAPVNVWAGASVEDQANTARIPDLLKIPARVHWLSIEPLLSEINLDRYLHCQSCLDRSVHWCSDPVIDWVIVGGESNGPSERRLVRDCTTLGVDEAHSDCQYCTGYQWEPTSYGYRWVKTLRDQCLDAGVPFWFKQWGGPHPESGGRLLDGVEYSQIPQIKR